MCIFSFRNFLHGTCYLVISADGIKPDPVKVSAVVNMPSPQNKEELRSFLGLVNYLGKFIISALLLQLLKKDSEWIFNYPQMQAFDKLNSEITNAPVLKFFLSGITD